MRDLKLLGLSTLLLLLAGGVLVGCGGAGVQGEATPDGAAATAEAEASGGGAGESEAEAPPRWILAANETPRGLLTNEVGAAPGYVLFSPFQSRLTYLVDVEGRVVHTWDNDKASGSQYLGENGQLIRVARMAEPPNFRAGGVAGYLQEISWSGELLWQWQMGDEQRMLHHDIEPLPNGNILAIAYEQKTPDEARAAGRRVDLVPEQGLWSEWIVEIEPIPPDGARIVWEWHVWDHLVQNHDPEAPSYGDPAAHPRRLDVNVDAGEAAVDEEQLAQLQALGYVPEDATPEDMQSDFLHMNAIDYHSGLDQIAVSVPEIGEIWIIDHSTTTAEARGSSGGRYGHGGDFLYRWGNAAAYGRGEPPEQTLFYQHEILWIPEGWPNAGNLTVFNNGEGRPDGEYSSVLEWTPPIGPDGNYMLPEQGPFGPAKVAWRYVAEEPESFFAPFVSGAHRLANGNTFVCSGPQGRFFEVTPEGEIVWEYRNPFHGGIEGWMPGGTEQFLYPTFRATKVPPDHPGLAGRDLSPLDPQPPAYEPPDAGSSGGR